MSFGKKLQRFSAERKPNKSLENESLPPSEAKISTFNESPEPSENLISAVERPKENHVKSQAISDSLAELELRLRAAFGSDHPRAKRVSRADYVEALSPLGFNLVSDGEYFFRQEKLEHLAPVSALAIEAIDKIDGKLLAALSLEPHCAKIDPRGMVFFDTETTGLGGGTGNPAYLIGLIRYISVGSPKDVSEDGGWIFEQYFFVEPATETAMLQAVQKILSKAELWVSFNGKSYDLPLLRERMVMNRLGGGELVAHLDLLHLARRVHRPRLSRVNLKSVEAEVLNFRRVGDVDGSESGPRYYQFQRTAQQREIAPMIHHNHWDILSLVALTCFYGQPVAEWPESDLRSLGKLALRTKNWDLADIGAESLKASGAVGPAENLRGFAAKAAGDKERALAHFERAFRAEAEPVHHLELAKLYEHFLKDPKIALWFTELGTGESEKAQSKREQRLLKKDGKAAKEG